MLITSRPSPVAAGGAQTRSFSDSPPRTRLATWFFDRVARSRYVAAYPRLIIPDCVSPASENEVFSFLQCFRVWHRIAAPRTDDAVDVLKPEATLEQESYLLLLVFAGLLGRRETPAKIVGTSATLRARQFFRKTLQCHESSLERLAAI